MTTSAQRLVDSRYSCPTCRAVFRTGLARCPMDGTRLVEALLDPLLDSIIADRYLIEELIGEGAMGRVYRVRHRRVTRKFALKVLFGDHASDPTMRKRFAREAEAASRLDHPNVISVIDFGATTEGLLYLVMDFVEGRELADLIDDEGPMEAERVARLVRQLASGLAHAHGHGLVHRDFKSSNVLVSGPVGAETAHIVDFGMAVLAEPEERVGVRLTTDGTMVGTLAYMAPEQSMGMPVDGRADLFSLGVVAYEMLAGTLPFEGSPIAMARQHLAVEPPLICDRVPGIDVDPVLELLSTRLMAKKPEDRYQRGEDVVAALDAWMAGLPAPAPAVAGAIVEVDEPEPVPAPAPAGAIVEVDDPEPAPAPASVSVSVSAPVSVPVSVPVSAPESAPPLPFALSVGRAAASPESKGSRRDRTTLVIPLSFHGRTLFIAIASAIAIGFALTLLILRGRQQAESEPSTPPPPQPALAAAPPSAPAPAPTTAALVAPPPVDDAPPPPPPSPSPAKPPASPPATPAASRPHAPAPAAAANVTARRPPPTTAPAAPSPTASRDPLLQARGLLASGDTAGAIKLVEQELLDTPGRPALYELLGDARARTGNRIAAIAAYRRYLALVGDADGSDRTARVRARLRQLGGL